MSNSCKKEDDVVPCNASADVTTCQITGLTARITEPVPTVGQTNDYVINSAAEYRALFAGKKLPAVDFATYTLLAGKTRTASASHVASQQVLQTCAGYTYAVKLAADASPAAANVVYYVLVPKLSLGSQVRFAVELPPVVAVEGVSTIETVR
ncbi:hypothetical protein QMK33_13120 [Hymenobacter sp. H14-R3]|uniref:hypothetical protein n=1 Tax=Hymenobacter sp. H14-R3 TaxID=3046308 RepID=UPI0024B8F371|nr:hypothetical protein [Hymenobacter sp. H14-R3]MDJ0366098.1 hypothetical protein [Hymenobacter sp. H14-R3]